MYHVGVDLHKETSWFYVIDKDGTVQYAYANADYTKRAEPDEVISKLQELKN